MKKLFSAILAGLLMATTVAASDIGEEKGIVPKIAEGVITIDGVKDAAYDEALIVDINQYLMGEEDGATAKAYMLWANGSFYFLAEVNDADVVDPSEEKQTDKPWETDSVEMFFDFGNEHADLVQQFRVDVSGWPSYYSEGGVDSAYGPEAAAPYFDEYAASKTDAGYNIEMRVNLEKYGLAEGQSIGLNLQVNDVITDVDGCSSQFNMVSSLGAGSWDADFYDYVTLGAQLDIEAPVAEEPAETEAPAEEPAEEPAPVEEPEETVAPVVVTAPQTFDFGVIAAISSVIALAGVALNKKRG